MTEYLGCEILRDREVKAAKILQSGYAERVLKFFAYDQGISYYMEVPFLGSLRNKAE